MIYRFVEGVSLRGFRLLRGVLVSHVRLVPVRPSLLSPYDYVNPKPGAVMASAPRTAVAAPRAHPSAFQILPYFRALDFSHLPCELYRELKRVLLTLSSASPDVLKSRQLV